MLSISEPQSDEWKAVAHAVGVGFQPFIRWCVDEQIKLLAAQKKQVRMSLPRDSDGLAPYAKDPMPVRVLPIVDSAVSEDDDA